MEWVTLGASFASSSLSWRLPMALSALWSLILLAVIHPLPESPRWLVKKRRFEDAREVLSALDDVPIDSDRTTRAIQEIQESLAVTGESRFIDFFSNGRYRLFHRDCLAAAGQLFQELCAINAIAFYVSTIFQQDLGLSGLTSRILGCSVVHMADGCVAYRSPDGGQSRKKEADADLLCRDGCINGHSRRNRISTEQSCCCYCGCALHVCLCGILSCRVSFPMSLNVSHG